MQIPLAGLEASPVLQILAEAPPAFPPVLQISLAGRALAEAPPVLQIYLPGLEASPVLLILAEAPLLPPVLQFFLPAGHVLAEASFVLQISLLAGLAEAPPVLQIFFLADLALADPPPLLRILAAAPPEASLAGLALTGASSVSLVFLDGPSHFLAEAPSVLLMFLEVAEPSRRASSFARSAALSPDFWVGLLASRSKAAQLARTCWQEWPAPP